MDEFSLPDGLLYNKDSSWVKLEGDIATVGVIEPAAKRVKEFVFARLPEKGKKIRQGEDYVALEALKWSGHLSSPVSGEIVEVNSSLFNDPSQINKEPYKNWVMKVHLDDKEGLKSLFKAKDVEAWIREKILGK